MPGWSKGVCMFFFQEMQTRSFFGKSLTEKEHFSIQSVEKTPSWPLSPANSALRPAAPHVCGQALRYACAWLRASWLSAISGASRPSASLGGGLRTAVALRAVLVL
ncbi:MAG: hypothetical protein SO010_02650, partial [Candidatus Limiplasma sp.]|nr:hypothetical protein [Candidatus Limiplasma sp.]